MVRAGHGQPFGGRMVVLKLSQYINLGGSSGLTLNSETVRLTQRSSELGQLYCGMCDDRSPLPRVACAGLTSDENENDAKPQNPSQADVRF